ncbi:MAG: hypothetical protein ACI8X5_002694 [Planctomycetota bacterium]|jgi:hypothetical protein
MNCNETHSLFSARIDSELEIEVLAGLELHIASCLSCSSEWLEFEQSVQLLQASGVRQVSEEYVDLIVAAATATEPQPVGFRLVLSHTAAALLGAALVLLLFWIAGENNREAELLQAEEPGQKVAIQSPATESAPVPEPIQVEIVERIVERVEYITIEKPAPRDASEGQLAQALRFTGTAFLEMSQAIDRFEIRVITPFDERPIVPEILAAAPDEPSSLEREPERIAKAPQIEPHESATIAVRQDGASLSLVTRGSLDEVVPALIAQLDDPNPRVAELVQQQLLEIWSSRSGLDWEQSPFGEDDSKRRAGRNNWSSWLAVDSDSDLPKSPAEEWSEWWNNEQLVIASANF